MKYINAVDEYGSFVDGRSVLEIALVRAFAESKGYKTEPTDKEPYIDANSPIDAWNKAHDGIIPKAIDANNKKSKRK